MLVGVALLFLRERPDLWLQATGAAVVAFVVLSLLGQSVLIRPLYISKLNTALQIVLVAVALLLSGFGLSAPVLMGVLVWLVAATTLGSGAAYVWVTVRHR